MNSTPDRPPVQVGSPAAILAVVPHLLGFVPQASLVVIGAGPPRDRVQVAIRYDLPDPPDSCFAAEIAAHILTSPAAPWTAIRRLPAFLPSGLAGSTSARPALSPGRFHADPEGNEFCVVHPKETLIG